MTGAPGDLAIGCRRAQILAGQLLLTLPIYAFVLGVVHRTRGGMGVAPDLPIGALRLVMVALAVISLAAIPKLTSGVLTAPRRPVSTATSLSWQTQRLMTASIIAMAMCESVALFGLVLAFVGGRANDYYGFALLSLVAFAWHFPRLSTWEAHLREMPAP